jgi:hypothetical protein
VGVRIRSARRSECAAAGASLRQSGAVCISAVPCVRSRFPVVPCCAHGIPPMRTWAPLVDGSKPGTQSDWMIIQWSGCPWGCGLWDGGRRDGGTNSTGQARWSSLSRGCRLEVRYMYFWKDSMPEVCKPRMRAYPIERPTSSAPSAD